MLELEIARREFTADGETVTATAITPTAKVLDYVPVDVSYDVQYTHGELPGAKPTRHTVGNVVESLKLAVACDAPGALRAFAAEFERALRWAEQNREDMQVFLRVTDPERFTAGVWFEARLFGGRVTFESSAGRVLNLTVERFPYWEGAWTRLLVKNNRTQEVEPDGVEIDEDGWATFGSVTNADDADPARDNWLMIEPPPGDAPAPLRIRIQNDYETTPATRLKTVRIGWYDRQQNLILEAEDGAGSVITTDARYSNERVCSNTTFKWVIPQDLYRDFVGPFRVWANGSLSGATWRFAAGYELTRMKYASRAVVDGANGWTDLGQIQLPAGGYRTPTRYPGAFWLDGSAARDLDFVLLQPVYQARRLTFTSGYNCVPGACIVDDPEQGVYYDFSGQKLPILDAWGNPIEAWPDGILPFQGIDTPHSQMLTFMLASESGAAVADRSALIEVFARPRYRVLP